MRRLRFSIWLASVALAFVVLAQSYFTFHLLPDARGAKLPVNTGPSVVPLRDEGELLEQLNQCAGTVQHYEFPPVGYEPPPMNSASRSGKRLYEKMNCASCHSIADRGGSLGPPLDGVGGHRGKDWLIARLLDPAQQMKDFPDVFSGRPNIMPHPNVTRQAADKIASYLLTLPEPKAGFLVVAHPAIDPASPSTESAAEQAPGRIDRADTLAGRDLFLSHGCARCHTVEGAALKFGPGLNGIGLRREKLWLLRLLGGKSGNPIMSAGSKQLSPEEAEKVVDFLLSLPP